MSRAELSRAEFEASLNRTGKKQPDRTAKDAAVHHPHHYTSHPSGVECITITEHMGFNLGNAIKYIWRADSKGAALQDLEKAAWYINREIQKRIKQPAEGTRE